MDLSFLIALLISLHLTSATEQDDRLDQLVHQVISDVCSANASTVTDFYRNIQNTSNASVQYPVNDVTWSQRQASFDISIFYDNFFSDISSNFPSLKTEYFKWCVHLYRPGNDTLYGCMKGEERSGSDDFLNLGLFNDFSYFKGYAATLVIQRGDFTAVLQRALLSVTITLPWLNHTTALYYSMFLSGKQPGVITSFPRQDDAFLKLGERKTFDCEVFGNLRNSIYLWNRDGEEVQLVVDVNDMNCTRLWGNFEDPCLNHSLPISYSGKDVDIGSFSNCFVGDEFRTGTRTLTLAFDTPTTNDTGEYTCSTVGGRYKSLYISVVFLDFPLSEITSQNGDSTNLQCTVKAPSNTTVYWTFNGQTLTSAGCEYADTLRTEDSNDSQFAIFQTSYQTCNTTLEDAGKYSCMVEYSVSSLSGIQTAQLDLDLTVSHSGHTGTAGQSKDNESLALQAGTAAGTVVGVSAIILISILASIAIWMKHVSSSKRRKSMKRRPSNRLLLKPFLYKDEAHVHIYSPGILKVGEMEFPRKNLELQEEIGRGKFGRVLKARAHGIVPNHPQLNLVAVKTVITSGSYGENLRLLSELELIKKVFRQPHRNICNLLGYCSAKDSTYIILEFACHGNLKQYLVACGTAVLEFCSNLHIDSQFNEVEPPSLMEALPAGSVKSLNTVSEFPSASNPLSIQVVDVSGDSKPDGMVPDHSGFSVAPGVLNEGQLCNFSHQIASGLKHLADINIIHCDLAARNILIAYDGVLKISDFGMARDVSEEDHPYQNLPLVNEEDFVPAKWAAIETLEKQQYTFKSEIWSFGVIVWEIASYGGSPYSEFTFGVTFEPFIRYLKEGRRLEKPNGLSDYIYQRLCACWSTDPGLRPTADDLIEFFQRP